MTNKKIAVHILSFLAGLILLFFAPNSAGAQTLDLGLIKGHVVDPQGAAVPGADVKLENKATGLQKATKTDDQGNFSFDGLPLVAKYTVTVTAANFSPAVQENIELRADIAAALDFSLAVSGTSAKVTVYGTVNGVNTETSEVSDRLDSQKLENTPILSDKLSSAVLLDSSVKPSYTTGDLFQDETLFVVDGEGRRQTTFMIDNANANDSWGRQDMFTALPYAAVQEFTIVTNAASAEYGRTAGAAVNVVSKSGTNVFHGDFLGMGRPDTTQADEKLAASPATNSMSEESGAFSGPLFGDRTQFLVAGEYNHQNRDAVITSPLDFLAIYPGNYKQGLFLTRIDSRLTDRDHLMLRANLDSFSDTNPQDVVAGVSLPTTDRVFSKGTYAAVASETHTFGSNLVNEARFQWQGGTPITQFIPQDPGPQLTQSGIFTNGDSRYAFLINHQYEEADTVSYIHSHHVIKAGVDLIESSSGGFGQEFGSGYLDGQFTISPTACVKLTPTSPTPSDTPCNAVGATPIAIQNLTISNVTNYTQTFGNQAYNIKETLWGVFVQDAWSVRQDLTLDLGVRYEGQTFTNDNNNVAPRLGFAWRVPHTRTTVLRGGYGVYYSEIRADEAAGYELGGPTGLFTFTAAPGQCGFPTSITPWASLSAMLASPGCTGEGVTQVPERTITIPLGDSAGLSQYLNTSLLRFYPNKLLNPYTQQWTLGVERELAKGWVLSIDYVGALTVKLDRPIDLNYPSLCTYGTVTTISGSTCVLAAPTTTTAAGSRTTAQANATRPLQPASTCTTASASFIPAIANCFNNYAGVSAVINDGTATYNAGQAKLNKQFSNNFSLLLSYTYSHAINNVEPDAAGQTPADYNELGIQEKASSSIDQRNRAALSGWYVFPLGIQFGAAAYLASGFPFNVTTGVDNNGDGNKSDRPFLNGAVIGRNIYQAPAQYDADASLQKIFTLNERFRLNVRADCFNLFNHSNFYALNAVYGNTATPASTFLAPVGGISAVGPSRMMQFSARLTF